MKSTKYQLLKAEYDHLQKQMKLKNNFIKRLEKEKEQAYYNGYKQGRFDELMKGLNEGG